MPYRRSGFSCTIIVYHCVFVCVCVCARARTQVCLWDTGGLERYTSMTANYYRNCSAVVLVYSLEEEDSLFILQDWLAEARSLNSDLIVPALWGNKRESENVSLTEKMTTAFSKENSVPAELVARVSAVTGEGVKEAFEKLIQTVHTRRGGSQLLQQQQQRGRTLEPLIDPQLQKNKRCAC